jgi:cAMP phosphodiesterase
MELSRSSTPARKAEGYLASGFCFLEAVSLHPKVLTHASLLATQRITQIPNSTELPDSLLSVQRFDIVKNPAAPKPNFSIMHHRLICSILFSACCSVCQSQAVFKVIPLGVRGGNDESNLSAYALAVTGTNAYVCLDAGTLYHGISQAIAAKLFEGTVLQVLRNNLKGYLISHPHLDHIAGLVLNSPDDSAKPIYGLPFCLSVLKEDYFNWKSWPNFGNEGEKPLLNKYHYTTLSTEEEMPLEQTSMYVKAFALSHSHPYQSTAFLIRHTDNYLLYVGDTGADAVEQSNKLYTLWQAISPLIVAGKLKAIFIEVSFTNSQPEQLLFGHLTPRLLMEEMKILSQLSGGLNDLPIVIMHIKPFASRKEIKRELQELNDFQLKLIFAEQAKLLEF